MKKEALEVKKSVRGKNFYLFVYRAIKQGHNPAKISKELNITKQRLNYYLATLKQRGFIKKIGYGTWEVCKDFDKKEVKKRVVIGKNSRGGFESLKPDMVRGHAFLFKLRLPVNLRNWKQRETYIEKLDINYTDYLVGGIKRGQQFKFKEKTIQLTDKSIILQGKESFVEENASKSKSTAIYEYLSIIRGLEKKLGANFRINGQYVFRVSRQHYSLIKNALAKQYDREGKKLEVYSHKGLWFVIDNSFNLHEAETLHPETSVEDNHNIQDFFNDLKENPITPSMMIKATYNNAQNLENYAVHLKAHVKSVQQLGDSVKELTKVIRDMEEKRKV